MSDVLQANQQLNVNDQLRVAGGHDGRRRAGDKEDVMNANAKAWRPSLLTRPLLLLPALVVALSVSFTGAASAQTAFQASVKGISPKTKPCATTFCGTASIAGYGPATWTINAISTTPASGPCPYGPPALASAFTYQATTTFELSDGSTLVLNESGLVCAPGNSASAPPQSFGFPEYANSSWTVESATGQFSGLTGGAGTDALHADGARISGTYRGT